MQHETIIILDFGSQYTQLIARRVRELGVYSELMPADAPEAEIERLRPAAYILSGGPASVYDEDAPTLPDYVLRSGKPVLGICYGMQLLTHALGGQVSPSQHREYGAARVALKGESPLFGGLPATGAIARTATNVRAGGRTPAAGIVHALTILLVTLGAGWLAGYLAMPALAALLVVTAWIMSEPGRWGERMRLKSDDRTLLFLTMALTVVTDLTIAIGVGTVAGLALRLIRKDVEPHEWTPEDRSKL